MRKIFMLLTLASVPFGAHAGTFTIDQDHSNVAFKIRHLVAKTKGEFKDFSGTVDFDKDKPASFKAEATIKTDTIDTNNEKRDGHLKSADFFNTAKYPTMTFKSTSVKSTGQDTLQVTGDLTMLGVTKPVVLDVEVTGVGNDPWGNVRAGFSGKGKLNRKDFGMVYNINMDKGGVVLGDDVELLLEIEAIQKK